MAGFFGGKQAPPFGKKGGSKPTGKPVGKPVSKGGKMSKGC